jgi:hypothetical protein
MPNAAGSRLVDRMAFSRAVGRLWTGEITLARTFWSYAMIGGTALNVVATCLALALVVIDAPAVVAASVFALPIPYNVLVLVAVWRSADRYEGPRLWADLARAAIVVWTITATAT